MHFERPLGVASGVATIAIPQGYREGHELAVPVGRLQRRVGLLGITSGRLLAAVSDFAYASPPRGLVVMPDAFETTTLLTPIKSPLSGVDELPSTTWRHRELAWRHANAALLEDRYRGSWVALEGDRIVAYGQSAAEVAQAARREGVGSPYLFRVTQDPGGDVGSFGV